MGRCVDDKETSCSGIGNVDTVDGAVLATLGAGDSGSRRGRHCESVAGHMHHPRTVTRVHTGSNCSWRNGCAAVWSFGREAVHERCCWRCGTGCASVARAASLLLLLLLLLLWLHRGRRGSRSWRRGGREEGSVGAGVELLEEGRVRGGGESGRARVEDAEAEGGLERLGGEVARGEADPGAHVAAEQGACEEGGGVQRAAEQVRARDARDHEHVAPPRPCEPHRARLRRAHACCAQRHRHLQQTAHPHHCPLPKLVQKTLFPFVVVVAVFVVVVVKGMFENEPKGSEDTREEERGSGEGSEKDAGGMAQTRETRGTCVEGGPPVDDERVRREAQQLARTPQQFCRIHECWGAFCICCARQACAKQGCACGCEQQHCHVPQSADARRLTLLWRLQALHQKG